MSQAMVDEGFRYKPCEVCHVAQVKLIKGSKKKALCDLCRKIKTPCGSKKPERELNDHISRCLNCQIILSVWHLEELPLLEAVEWYDRGEGYVLYSGGKDSGVLADWAHEIAKPAGINVKGCVAVDTGTATPDWLPFIKDSCQSRGWNLTVLNPPEKFTYDKFVHKFGFPHAGGHTFVMRFLKLFAIRKFEQANRDKKVYFMSGIRQLESQRRFGNVQPLSIDTGVWGVAPIWSWSDEKVWDYFKRREIPRSPAYEHLNISGDCNCGAFGTREEFFIYEAVYPEIANMIKRLMAEIKDMDHIKPKFKEWGGNRDDLKNDKAKVSRPAIENAICSECAYRVTSLTEFD